MPREREPGQPARRRVDADGLDEHAERGAAGQRGHHREQHAGDRPRRRAAPSRKPELSHLNGGELTVVICPPVMSMAMPRPAVMRTSVAMMGWIPTTETRKPFQAPSTNDSTTAMTTAVSDRDRRGGVGRAGDERAGHRAGDRDDRPDRQVDAAGGDDQGHPERDEQERRGVAEDVDRGAEQVPVADLDGEEAGRAQRVEQQQDEQGDDGPEQPVTARRSAACSREDLRRPGRAGRGRGRGVGAGDEGDDVGDGDVVAVGDLGDLLRGPA